MRWRLAVKNVAHVQREATLSVPHVFSGFFELLTSVLSKQLFLRFEAWATKMMPQLVIIERSSCSGYFRRCSYGDWC